MQPRTLNLFNRANTEAMQYAQSDHRMMQIIHKLVIHKKLYTLEYSLFQWQRNAATHLKLVQQSVHRSYAVCTIRS